MKFVELEVELLDHEPRSWRRFRIPKAGATLATVHDALQEATGWKNCHLAKMETKNAKPLAQLRRNVVFDDGDTSPTFAKATLASARKTAGTDWLYNYDVGDDWWCAIIVRGEVEVDVDANAYFVAGEGAWPPDSCGGIPAFQDLLVTYAKHQAKKTLNPDERELIRWLGAWCPDTTPNRLPLAPTSASSPPAKAANKMLKATAKKKSKKQK